MTQEQKEKIIYNWFECLRISWTYARLTETEKERLETIKNWIITTTPKTQSEKTIIHLVNSCYHSFLIAIGFSGYNWREEQQKGKKDNEL